MTILLSFLRATDSNSFGEKSGPCTIYFGVMTFKVYIVKVNKNKLSYDPRNLLNKYRKGEK
jgi:hypothetical protein